MEQARAGTDYDIPLRTQAIRDPQPRIHCPLRVQNAARPGLPIRTHAEVYRQVVGGAPVILSKKTAVGVVQHTQRCVSNRVGIVTQLKHRWIEGWLCETRRLKPLEFDEHWIVFYQIRNATQRVAGIRSDAEEDRFKRVEQGEGFRGTHPVVVAAEAECMFADILREVIYQFEARLFIKIRVAAIDADRELVCHFHVRLRRNSGEIVVAACPLKPEFVH